MRLHCGHPGRPQVVKIVRCLSTDTCRPHSLSSPCAGAPIEQSVSFVRWEGGNFGVVMNDRFNRRRFTIYGSPSPAASNTRSATTLGLTAASTGLDGGIGTSLACFASSAHTAASESRRQATNASRLNPSARGHHGHRCPRYR
jgi:hypothetical protein